MAKTDILAPDMVKMTEGGTVTLECVVTEHDRRRFMTCVTKQNCFSEMVRAAHLSKFGRKLTNLRHGKKTLSSSLVESFKGFTFVAIGREG